MKKRALDRVYEEFETNYKKQIEDKMEKPNYSGNAKEDRENEKKYEAEFEEKMQKSIDADIEKMQEEVKNIQKQIAGMEASEKGLDDETRERLEKEIDKKSKKINNLEGYRKNKTQITKIIEYRGILEGKLSETITARDDSKKAYGEAKKELEEVNKILKDEKKTMEMEQDEYNDLQIRKEEAEKELKTQREIFEKSKIKIEDLKTKIGKCNLAWRTLFANKTWDDIQLRAAESKGRYTRKVEDEERLEEGPESVRQEVEDQEIQAQIAETVRRIQQSQKQERKGENLPAKVTTWTKIKNFFKSIPEKFRETFGKVEPENGEAKGSKPVRTKTATEQQKDAFLESLRQHVDAEYRKEVREAKEQEYIDKHKAKEQEER